jgi:cytochrome bd-type quinol oxidase subunit 2
MVKYRNPVLVIVFTIITFGIYGIYWLVSTTNELRRLTSTAPDPWALLLLLIPFLNLIVMIWYYWKYSAAVEEISGVETIILFLLWIFFSPAAVIITQLELNKKAKAGA